MESKPHASRASWWLRDHGGVVQGDDRAAQHFRDTIWRLVTEVRGPAPSHIVTLEGHAAHFGYVPWASRPYWPHGLIPSV